MIETNEILEWRGRKVIDTEGNQVGTLEEIYLDQETDRPEWALIDGTTFVPLTDAAAQGNDVRLGFSRGQIKDAPQADADGELSQDEEAALYRHYGLDYSEGRSDSGLPQGQASEVTPDSDEGVVGDDVSGPETDAAMTRSQEELRVGTTRREAGRARLRKHVVTEMVTKTVPVSREQVTLEREPITDANVGDATAGPELSDEEHEGVLHEEEVVVEKRAVPVERVRLDKETVTEERQVDEELRKEEIELIDGQGAPAQGHDGERATDDGIDRR